MLLLCIIRKGVDFKVENEKWFNQEIKEVETKLQTNQEKGLSSEEALKRKEQYGANQLKAAKKKSLLQRFADQFKDFSIIVLIIAAIVSGVVGVAEGERNNRYNYYFNCCNCKCYYWSNTRSKSRKIFRSIAETNRPCI